MTRHRTSTPARPLAGNSKTAIGAMITVLVAAIGGTAFMLSQGNQPSPTTEQTNPASQPVATQPAPPTEKTDPPAKPTSGQGDKSTKPKPPPPDPG